MRRRFVLGLLVAFTLGCSAIGGIFGGVTGETTTSTDDSCDRRYAPAPQAFCQEIISTVAGAPFQADCIQKFDAAPAPTLCPRLGIIGGCEYDTVFQDGSRVIDWFYDLSTFDGGVDAFTYADRHLTVGDIQKKCADGARYDAGAAFVAPPQ
jgi:hypothetical protein